MCLYLKAEICAFGDVTISICPFMFCDRYNFLVVKAVKLSFNTGFSQGGYHMTPDTNIMPMLFSPSHQYTVFAASGDNGDWL